MIAYLDDPETRRANRGYIKASMRTPLLSWDVEFSFARRWHADRDVSALHAVVRAYGRRFRITSCGSIVRTETTTAQKSLFFNLRRLRARIADVSGGPMTRGARQKIARALKVNVSDVEAMEVRLGAADQSLNAPMHADGEEEDRQDFLADVRANPEEAMIGMRDGAARSRRLA